MVVDEVISYFGGVVHRNTKGHTEDAWREPVLKFDDMLIQMFPQKLSFCQEAGSSTGRTWQGGKGRTQRHVR
jgi:hypothetical protein